MTSDPATAPAPGDVTEPTAPGWYATASGNDYLIFLRMEDIDIPDVFTRVGQWMAFTQSGEATECHWDYIAQAGPIVPLVKGIHA